MQINYLMYLINVINEGQTKYKPPWLSREDIQHFPTCWYLCFFLVWLLMKSFWICIIFGFDAALSVAATLWSWSMFPDTTLPDTRPNQTKSASQEPFQRKWSWCSHHQVQLWFICCGNVTHLQDFSFKSELNDICSQVWFAEVIWGHI